MSQLPESNHGAGLLEQIASQPIDDDYLTINAQVPEWARVSKVGKVAGVTFGLFGLLLTVTWLKASSESSDEAYSRSQLVSQIVTEREDLAKLRTATKQLQTSINSLKQNTKQDPILDLVSDFSTETGSTPSSGSGLEVVANNSVTTTDKTGLITDRDLRQLVNGLWASGAKAIAVNGKRLGPLTAIRTAGASILINYKHTSPPYTVAVLGDSKQIATMFPKTTHGVLWGELQSKLGIQLRFSAVDNITLPALEQPVLRFVQVKKD